MKKMIGYIVLGLFLTSCNLSKEKTYRSNSVNKEDPVQVQSKTIFFNDTLLINTGRFIQTRDKDSIRFYCLTTINGDTIIPFADYYSHLELLDFNEDGITDIRVFTFSNTPNQCDNYLFDNKNNRFHL